MGHKKRKKIRIAKSNKGKTYISIIYETKRGIRESSKRVKTKRRRGSKTKIRVRGERKIRERKTRGGIKINLRREEETRRVKIGWGKSCCRRKSKTGTRIEIIGTITIRGFLGKSRAREASRRRKASRMKSMILTIC